MSPPNQAQNRDEIVAAFMDALTKLKYNDEGLTSDNSIDVLEYTAQLVYQVQGLTRDANTVEDILLYRVASLTGDLLTTVLLTGGPEILRQWLLARAARITAHDPAASTVEAPDATAAQQ